MKILSIQAGSIGQFGAAGQPPSRCMTPNAKLSDSFDVLVRDRQSGTEDWISRRLAHHSAMPGHIGISQAICRPGMAQNALCHLAELNPSFTWLRSGQD